MFSPADEITMSEELEWELFEIFESGTFVFPIYEHNAARRVVHYLLMRGILDEEIAEAIEDSTIDLHLWLNRVQGKFMVGEWVIAWMNECREEYEREQGYDDDVSLKVVETDVGRISPLSISRTTTTFDDEPEATGSDGRVTDIASIRTTSTLPDRDHSLDGDSCNNSRPSSPKMFRRIRDENGELPARGRANRPSNLEFLKDSLVLCDGLFIDQPDSGNVSDIYTRDHLLGSFKHDASCPDNCPDSKGLPVCDNCSCAFIHYSYRRNLVETENSKNEKIDEDLCIKDECERAMELNFDTLDKDGPGFIFILTDSKHSTLSWSVEHCYKLASSRQPERCVTEFRGQNIDVDLIWKVKVRRHLEAIGEVHAHLSKHNIHSDWFKCSLSTIMEVVSKTVRQYKV